MPPIRTMPIVKPVKTERTHEENQERAYIAASRRSDRSLEARVESARRASEIHKKRTGRSLRVREEDVMNEEMYEEEDDDLPMQFRRINALHPGLAYSAFNERVNSYLAGQMGVRNYLHQAIYQANQSNQYNNQFFNPLMAQQQQHQQSQSGQQFQMHAQTAQPASHGRSASVATPQGLAKSPTPAGSDHHRRSSMQAPTATSPGTGYSRKASSKPSSPNQVGVSPQSARPAVSPSTFDENTFPLTMKLPTEAQQLLDGQQGIFGVQPFHMTPGIPMPSMGNYSYNPNGKPSKRDSAGEEQTGLNQTLSSGSMDHSALTTPPLSAPLPASTAGDFDYNFGYDMFNNGADDLADSKFDFDFGFGGSGSNIFTANNSGQVTPAAGSDSQWNPDDFFNYSAASD